jgi:hypothetical protein
MSRFGTSGWCARRGGRLTTGERAAMTLTLLGRRIQARFFRSRRDAASLSEVSFALPDSSLSRAALDHCVNQCDASIVNHSLRCYAWGVLLGASENRRFDREALAVASLLHDVELGRTERRAAFACTCFAGAGAKGAGIFLAEQKAPAPLVGIVCEAISLHLNPRVPPSMGVEAHLLNAGAALDVVGAGSGALHPSDRARVFDAYPFLSFKTDMVAAMDRERKAAPGTRAEFLMRLGFGAMIARAPHGG